VRPPPVRFPRRWWAIGTVALVAVAILGWRVLFPPSPSLDPNRVVVFPLAETGLHRLEPGVGGLVAEMIGTALEGAEPLRWTYGGSWLDPDERQDPARVSVQLADSIARLVRARYHVLGSVVERGDSAHVILRLHDVRLHDEVEQRTARGLVHVDSVIGASYRATIALVANLLEGDREVDLAPVIARNPAAVTLWMRGDQEYRRSRFAGALELYRRALASDSLLAMAALKGASAAHWQHDFVTADGLLDVAFASASELSAKHVHYAWGLRHFAAGAGDSAVAHFSAALDGDPRWPEAWAALAETYRHLMLASGDPDSVAVASFRRAVEVDPEFTPPLLHLIEYALWRGDIAQADRYADRYRAAQPDSGLSLETDMMVRCARLGPSLVAWDGLAQTQPFKVLAAAVSLGVRGSYPRCAEAAYRAVRASPASSVEERWGALLGLQSVLLATGRVDEVRPLLDGDAAGQWLYLIDAAAGYACEDRARAVTDANVRDFRSFAPPTVWLYGQWAARQDSAALVRDIAEFATATADSTGTRRDRLIAQSLRAWAALASADTAAAIELFRALTPTGRKRDLSWQPWESLGAERQVLAQLLFQRGRYEEAYRVAATLDHPEPIIYPLYLPESLELRARAAEELGWRDVALHHRRRLASLRSPTGAGGR
jgi:tetratricopeptide (TPR) repeat protein